MNKTDYLNALKQELQGLPSHVIEETLSEYDAKISEGVASGQTENEVVDQLLAPKLIAAQKRAGTQYQKLKSEFSPRNLAGLFIALIGVMVFNLFMMIPAFLYSAFLFVAYVFSLCIYGAGIGILAASMSGVPEMKFKIPGSHYRVDSHTHQYHHVKSMPNITVDVTDRGITIDKEGVQELDHENWHGDEKFVYVGDNPKTISIKNHVEAKHFFSGFGLLLGGTGLLMLCLMMTRLTLIGIKKYVLWNWSLLRAPLSA